VYSPTDKLKQRGRPQKIAYSLSHTALYADHKVSFSQYHLSSLVTWAVPGNCRPIVQKYND